jgi:hypothetical protein
MKNTLILASILVLNCGLGFSAFAQTADFSGHWVGTGTIYQKPLLVGNPTQSPCSKIELWMEQTAATLTTRHYTATCGAISPDWGPDVMQIKDGKVIEQGDEIGTLKGDTLITVDDTGSVSYAFNLKVTGTGDQRTLHSYYGVKNGMGTIVIEGTSLKLVP